jgi:peptidoglycan hydrolase-like protein with peptidoglycan-binding domain
VKPPRLLFIPLALLLSFFYPDLTMSSLAQKKAAAPAAKKPAAKAPAASAKSGAPKAAPRKYAAKKSAGGTKGSRTAAARRPATQQQPDNDRIREIQEALAAKGYNVEPNGVWGQQSVDALKKFQEDQNINNMSGRGKLDSLTLIALGLGPRRETPAKGPVPDSKATEGKNP